MQANTTTEQLKKLAAWMRETGAYFATSEESESIKIKFPNGDEVWFSDIGDLEDEIDLAEEIEGAIGE